ncbi:peritrophin-1-like [Lucilia cuprina]|uniref:peritrophin-1-like n=1 Tax=Lucilia cuprina TaxID=7375 RepID=UPI001F06DDBC|nr:peritrophin-1-like [Lucilia cuprina]
MGYKILTITLLVLVAFHMPKNSQAKQYVSHKNCNYMKKGTIIANPANCSQFIICNGLRSTLGECPKGQYFNEDMLSCNKKNPIQCREKIITTTGSTISNTEEEKVKENHTEAENFIRPFCFPSQTYYIPYPFNCFYYYECKNGVLTLKRCRLGFTFDWIKRRCVLSQAEAICYVYGQ